MQNNGTHHMHGGKRRGAGRPPGINRKMVTLRLPIWLAEWLKQRADDYRYSQGKLVEEALINHFGLEKPKQ